MPEPNVVLDWRQRQTSKMLSITYVVNGVTIRAFRAGKSFTLDNGLLKIVDFLGKVETLQGVNRVRVM